MTGPKRLRVGPATYTIAYRDTNSDRLGVTEQRKSLILVDPDQSAHSLRDTLLHEALHAAFYESGLCHAMSIDDDNEERLIRLLTPWLLGLIRDNPNLITYLTT